MQSCLQKNEKKHENWTVEAKLAWVNIGKETTWEPKTEDKYTTPAIGILDFCKQKLMAPPMKAIMKCEMAIPPSIL